MTDDKKIDEKKTVQHMDLRCANRLHLRLEEKWAWRGCQLCYQEPLAAYIPRKMRAIGEEKEEDFQHWSFLTHDDDLDLHVIVFRLHFGLQPSAFDLGKLTVDGNTIYCRIYRPAHVETDESAYKNRTQKFKSLKHTPLRDKTLEEIVKLLIAD